MTRFEIPLPPLPRTPGQRRDWREPTGSSLALLLCEAARRREGVIVAITADSRAARTLEDELGVFAGDLPVLHFPDWETLPYDLFAPHPQLVSQRIDTLNRLPGTRRGVLVVPVSTLMQRLAPRLHIAGSGLAVARGQRLNLADEQRRLEASGYRNVPQVGEHGEFAVRGALLDIFPMGAEEPYRIELFDDEIESIRAFDPETQRSSHPVEAVDLLPAREFPLTEEAMRAFRDRLRERFPIDVRRCPLYQDMKEGVTPGGIEYYLPLFFRQTSTLFDYLADDALFVLGEGAGEAADQFWAQTLERYDQRAHDIERPVLPPAELYLPPDKLREQLNKRLRVDVVEPGHEHAIDTGTQPAPELPLNRKGEEPATSLRHFLAGYPGRVLIAADSAGRREALVDTLASAGLKPEHVDDWSDFLARHPGESRNDEQNLPRFAITIAPLEQGFALTKPVLTVLTERELYGERVRNERERKRRRGTARDPDTIIRDLTELTVGAPIVHVDHGVGRYQGLLSMDVGGMAGEFLTIEYAKGDKLYVPVSQLGLVSRYSGTAPELAPLHSLGGDAWERARRKAAEKVRDVAAELLAIYAQRQARGGESLPIDRQLVEEFGSSFPFEETPDQESAIEAVLDDLAAPRAMDRVICGDVGFGKTEVALRAAFVAAMNGKQVAVVVPTTLLSRQHFKTFSERLKGYPVHVAQASRLVGSKELAAVKKGLADGQIDIVVGTHALLGKAIKFRDLGLIVVDEEQHFGVAHKEKLKTLRSEVHVLTLTATPIPRTLQLALSGVREMSIIATPPVDRLAVRTFISPFDPVVVREALLRERYRGGQAFYVCPRIEDLAETKAFLEKAVPEVRVAVAHGQMPPTLLEDVMAAFYDGKFDVLLSTAIVESGLDIPTANTLIVHRADMFGLAQVYQLRGRVGRSKLRAYALLTLPANRKITPQAERRLKVLQSLDTLGAGFQLASHDLDIRGAGNLLGEEQSGHIKEVGYELYQQMLEEAVLSLKAGISTPVADKWSPQITIGTPVLIPEDYVTDLPVRLGLYRRLAEIEDDRAIEAFAAELVDRFGPLPEEVEYLLQVVAIKTLCRRANVERIEVGPKGAVLALRDNVFANPEGLIAYIAKHPVGARVRPDQKVVFFDEWETPNARLKGAAGILRALAGIAEKGKKAA